MHRGESVLNEAKLEADRDLSRRESVRMAHFISKAVHVKAGSIESFLHQARFYTVSFHTQNRVEI